jgi:hypothetical protein
VIVSKFDLKSRFNSVLGSKIPKCQYIGIFKLSISPIPLSKQIPDTSGISIHSNMVLIDKLVLASLKTLRPFSFCIEKVSHHHTSLPSITRQMQFVKGYLYKHVYISVFSKRN